MENCFICRRETAAYINNSIIIKEKRYTICDVCIKKLLAGIVLDALQKGHIDEHFGADFVGAKLDV